MTNNYDRAVNCFLLIINIALSTILMKLILQAFDDRDPSAQAGFSAFFVVSLLPFSFILACLIKDRSAFGMIGDMTGCAHQLFKNCCNSGERARYERVEAQAQLLSTSVGK